MTKRFNVFAKLFISAVFLFSILEPVRALAVDVPTVRLNLSVTDVNQIDQCELIDPILSTNKILHWVSLSIPEDKVQQRIEYYQTCAVVTEAYTDTVSKLALLPTDADYDAKQWNLEYMDLELAWDITTGSSDVVVAVIDTGVDGGTSLSDFGADTILKGASVLSDPYTHVQEILEDTYVGQYSYDGGSHGTAVASVIAAAMNTKGITGIAPGVKILPIKVFRDAEYVGEEVPANDNDIANAIIWAVDHGADIINLSLGGEEDNASIKFAVTYADNHNVIVVASSGNSSDHDGSYSGYMFFEDVKYPAAYPSVIAVGSVNFGGWLSNFSDVSGKGIDITSYGEGIWLPWLDENKFKNIDGTSFSAPSVAGVLALALSKYPELTADQAEALLYASAKDVHIHSTQKDGYDYATGFGIANAYDILVTAARFVGEKDTNVSTDTAVSIKPEVVYSGTISPVLDEDYYCFETLKDETTSLTVHMADGLFVNAKIMRVDGAGNLILVNNYTSYQLGYIDTMQTTLTKGKYCVIISSDYKASYHEGSYDLKISYVNPNIPTLTGTSSAGVVADNGTSNGPVTLTTTGSYVPVLTVTKNGESYSLPSNLTFTETGTYVVVLDDGHHDPITYHFTITGFRLADLVNGKTYNQSVTLNFTADSATINGEPLISGTTVSADGSYHLVFVADSTEYVFDFTIDKTGPTVSGLTYNKYIDQTPAVTFTEGTATLNGQPFTSGSVINNDGENKLVVTDAYGNQTIRWIRIVTWMNTLNVRTYSGYDYVQFDWGYLRNTADYYLIYLIDPITSEQTLVGQYPASYYTTLSGLTSNSKYSFSVVACVEADERKLCSTPATFVVYTQKLGRVYFNPSVIDHKTMYGKWTAVTGAEGYDVFVNDVYVETITGTEYTFNLPDPTTADPIYYRLNIVAFKMVNGVKEYGYDSPYATNNYRPMLQAPQNLTLVSQADDESVFSWSAVTSASYYEITCKPNTGPGSVVKTQVPASELRATLTGLTPSRRYDCTVQPFVQVNETLVVSGNISSITQIYSTPAAPILSGASYGINNISLSNAFDWYAKGYEYYELNKSTMEFEKITTSEQSTISLTKRTQGESYTFKVRAYRIDGGFKKYSPFSNEFTVTVVPTNNYQITVREVNYNSAYMSWYYSGEVTGFDLFYSTTLDGEYTYIDSTISKSEAIVTGFDFNKTYYIKNRPFLMDGDTKIVGAFSPATSFKTALSEIEYAEVFSVNYNTNKLQWLPVPGATGYDLYAQVGSSYLVNLVKASITTTTYTHTSLTAGTQYRYQLRPYRLVGTTKVYGPNTNYFAATPLPNAPEVTATTLSPTSIKATWPVVPGATGYEVSYTYYGEMVNGYKLMPLITTNSITLTNVPPGHEFVILVRAYRLVGTTKIYGDYGFDFSMTNPANPTVTATSLSPTSLKLSWNAVPYATGYFLITFNPETRLFEKLQDSKALSYTLTNLKTGEKRLYMVKSYIQNEISPNSINTQFISAAPAPDPVTGAKVSDPKTTQLTLSWNASSAATGYEITRSTSATGTFAFVANVEGALTYTNSGLVFNTTYYYKIRPYTTVDGEKTYGTASAAFSGKTALDTVLNPSAVFTSYNSNLVSWSPITGVTTYEVYYSIGSSTTYALLKTVTGTNFVHTSLLTNTKYNYKIRATKTVSLVKYVGAFSSIVYAIPTPTAPVVSAQSTGTDSIKATWPAVAGATGYEITWSLNADLSASAIVDQTSPIFTLSGLTTDVPVYLKARAYRLVGAVKVYSADSETVSAKPLPNTPILSGSVLDYQGIRLTWNAILNAASYELYKLDPDTGDFVLVQDSLDLSYTENGLTAGSVNVFKIKTYVLVNDVRIYSQESPVISLTPIPSPVFGLMVSNPTYAKLSLSWNAVNGATGYEITRSTSATGTFTLVAYVEDGLSYSDTGLTFNTSFFYKVRSYTTVKGTKVFGNSTSVVTGKTTLETVLNPKAAYTAYNSNLISWDAVSGANGYEIYRSIGTSTTYALLATVATTFYTNITLLTNTKYNYKIRAYRLVGTVKVYGAYSSIVSATPLPWAPTVTVASVNNTTLKVSWPAVAGANGYEVSYATSENGTYTKLALLTTTSVSISKLLTNTTYYVKVRAYRTVNYVKIYGASSIIVSAKPIPATPVVTAVSGGVGSAKVSWLAITGASGYEVYLKTPESMDYFLAQDSTALTVTLTRLQTGTVQSVKVVAYQMVNGEKVYSLESAVKTVTPIPSTVTGFRLAMPSITSLKLTWTSVDGATGYEIFKSSTATGTFVSIGKVDQVNEFTVTGLTFNTTTYYKIRALYTDDYGTVAGLSTTALTAKTVPSTVQLKVVNTSYNANALSWDAIEGASGYEVYVSTGTSTYYTLLKTQTITAFNHTALVFNAQYNYKVRAYRLVGTTKIFGAFSTLTSVKTAVTAPTAIVSSTHDSIGLTWNAVTGASGYEVSIATSLTGPYTVTTQTAVSKTYSGLTTGTTYYVKIRSYRLISTTKVYGQYAPVITVTPCLSVPALSLDGLTSTTVTFSWAAVAGATDYEVRIKSDAIDAEWVVESVSELTVIFSDLDPSSHYVAEIRAVKKVGEVPYYSEYSSDLAFSYADTY